MIRSEAELKLALQYPDSRLFEADRFPPSLEPVVKPFNDLANHIYNTYPISMETAICLRKMLEARDAILRSFLLAVDSQSEQLDFGDRLAGAPDGAEIDPFEE